ncbi:MCE family protein [Rhodococcus triatomae]|uniref:Phospholipid/cholesterol/gamma-HCH transport system substrate-binding protein n=1 Tax=Rhodococcus triatomae TaxID=300028 RepID=A0A1G8B8Q0_9NOCA|nr:MlaD family protein [Rhodococcus triatomae]QNG17534.1 MCE family protein [Rhodococcus triatomae]QNG22798.1 MCE family protein [Rhodococcus triatomae]SDH29622.1 phospholipid/cholesterol/gamma-HCH transport system substrate-binding protein [Rhodococcus triatomae]
MMLSRFVRVQLVIFSILTVIGLVVMSVQYVRVPSMLGIGKYDVSMELVATGGLYPHANVAFRGTNVGVVDSVTLTDEGVVAKLSIDRGYDIPADVDASVKSVSAVGEQYVDLIPRSGATLASAGGATLSGGDVIPLDRTSIPQDVGEMLDQADILLDSIADTRLKTVVDEAFHAFNGSGPDLQRLIDSARLFVEEAADNSEATRVLIDQVGPLLDTQIVSSDAIRSWTADLVTFSDQLRASDPTLRSILATGPGAAEEANILFQELSPTLPLLLANLVSVGEVATIYHPSIEQILVLYPPLTAALATAATGGPIDEGAIVDFSLALNDPPACTTGFLPPDQRRPGNDTTVPPTPNNLFCNVAPDDPSVVRGARNIPCMEYPGRRAPTVQGCRDGWTPLGNNPPTGPVQSPDVPSYTTTPSSHDGGADAGPAPVVPATARPYDPSTGAYTAPDGRIYTQPNLASTREDSTWQTMMTGQQ